MIETLNLLWVVVLLYAFFDVNYFLRALFTIIFGSILHKRCKITDTTTMFGICLTNDVDMMLCHMNNARYLRELDFARYHFYERTGLFRRLFKAKTITLQTASCIRYRQSISIFSAYRIHTKMVYWDQRNVYLEHRFVTSDGCVRAVGMSRQTILSGTITALFKDDDDSGRVDDCTPSPPRPPRPTEELRMWISSMEASSQMIKTTGDGDQISKSTSPRGESRGQKEGEGDCRFNGEAFINR